MPRRRLAPIAVALAACASPACAATAGAADASSLAAIQRQIDELSRQLAALRRSVATTHRRPPAIVASGPQSFTGADTAFVQPVSPGHFPGVFRTADLPDNGVGPHMIDTAGEQQASALGRYGRFRVGGVIVQLGGFVEALGIVRTRNLVSDFSSNFDGIPFPNQPTYHEPEYRGSARQSRFSLLIEGKPSPTVRVAGYVETDFGAAGISSNSNESNSYALRIRQAYATYDDSALGLHVLGGQAWSMLTVDRDGITPRQENIPLTPDGQQQIGFDWTRQPQLRVVGDFDHHRIWTGLSFESPQTTYGIADTADPGVVGGTVNVQNPGGALLNPRANYSVDIAPDVIAKIAYDPSWGHYELYGLARFLSSRVTFGAPSVGSGRDRTVLAGGGGAAMLLPLAGRKLVFQASTLVGQGIGRYGAGQLPDATVSSDGSPVPIPEFHVLLGLVGHPVKSVDLYAYAGAEEAARRAFDLRRGAAVAHFGYGNPAFQNGGCAIEGSTVCAGQTRGLAEGTLGVWWRFAKGDWGTLQTGSSWSYVRRTAFEGVGATPGSRVTPQTDDNIVLLSFRYLPFL